MGFRSDMGVLWHLLSAKAKSGADHQERLEAFYSGQREAYDSFRKRLLHGRERLMELLPLPSGGGTLIDMGGGTGSNLEALGDKINHLERASVLDLCPSLLHVARERITQRGWTNVDAIHGDATQYKPPEPVDAITFSYSLTMIPDWFESILHAYKILKPGGIIGVVDFYVPRKWPDKDRKSSSGFTRTFWPTWFGYDNVFLSSDHLPFLSRRFDPITVEENRGKVPYMLGMKAPYYIFIGKKPLQA
jgi:S-adenosylmethionine-diacylgycerolhomoserine-N-methlytransferase